MTARRPTVLTADPLTLFHPLIAEWFRDRIGEPTEVQRRTWPEIAAERHVLATAPTGSGKTLAAFLWAIHQLLTGAWEHGALRVLYISPLKALNNDVRRNLLGPLAEITGRFRAAGLEVPEPVVLTRSGDTPEEERRRMRRAPPEILVTTPESLNILLTSASGRQMLGGLKTVILDEIHAVAGSKRGVHLITAVERLALEAGPVQRIALSATVRPLPRVARFVAGRRLLERGPGEEARYEPRPIRVVEVPSTKRYELVVDFPGAVADDDGDRDEEGLPANLWELLTAHLKRRIRAQGSTLLFANNRRRTEKIARFLNEGEPEPLAYAHHGSLARELRQEVEARLKAGDLRAIVATNSLELGIDIGSLDEVILIQTPPTVASAVQRLGRAGHGVGEVSRGRLYPLFGRDFLSAAAMAPAVLAGEVEEVQPVEAPLDVLAQVVLSLATGRTWLLDDLYAFLRTADPYRDLSRRQFDLVLDMLAGRYADTRVAELRPRVLLDRVEGTVRARRGVDRLLYLSGGTIPDRGYFQLKVQESGARLGELDEEFVWERSVGDTFTLGAQSWRIRQITPNEVLVSPAGGPANFAPFWRGEENDRSFFLSDKIGRFLGTAQELLERRDGRAELRQRLTTGHRLTAEAADQLLDLLDRQRAATGTPLPHRHHLVVERVTAPGDRAGRRQLLIHNFWGGRVNRPLALALEAAWEARFGSPLSVIHENDCLAVDFPPGAEPMAVPDLFHLVAPEALEGLLARRLESSGFFGARFRENAGRALLLPKAGFAHRTPLWLHRLRSKKLLEAVSGYGDFPMVMETWRTCLRDEMDLAAAKALLLELAEGEIAVSEATTGHPSPFAANLVWKQTNRYMYEDDTPEGRGPGRALSGELLQELVTTAGLRPRVPAAMVRRFEEKAQRTAPGYAPQTAEELLDWVRERVWVPGDEWRELLRAVERDAAVSTAHVEEWLEALSGRLAGLAPASVWGVTAVELLPLLERGLGRALGDRVTGLGGPAAPLPAVARTVWEKLPTAPVGDREDPLGRVLVLWLKAYGPLPQARLGELWGLSSERLAEAVAHWTAEERWVVGDLGEGVEGAAPAAAEVCDARNLETLLRMLRAASRVAFEAQPLDALPLFLAVHQGVVRGDGAGRRTGADGDLGDLKQAMEPLFGYPAPAAAWEGDLLPARLRPYHASWLDRLFVESDLVWFGVGAERLSFALAEDLDLFASGGAAPELFDGVHGRLSFEDLVERSGLGPADLVEELWGLAWEGRVSSTTFLPVRQGLLQRFRPPAGAASRRRPRPLERGSDRWQGRRSSAGEWFALPAGNGPEPGLLERVELDKLRVRQLLSRYGVLFRELSQRELPELAWGRLFRALRLMELSGEVVSGQFFEGVPGLQFASHRALATLKAGLPEDAVFWLNALDPASPCGLGLEGGRGELPPRLPGVHLVFHGRRRVLVSRRSGAELTAEVSPDHPDLPAYLEVLKVLLTREFQPLRALTVETVNGDPAAASPYAPVLAAHFSVTRELDRLRLRRRY